MSINIYSLLFSLILSIVYTLPNDKLSVGIIANFFKVKKIAQLTILSCWDRNTKVHAVKELSSEGFMVSYSINSISELPERRSGGVLDLGCDDIMLEILINMMSKKKMFISHTEWLLIDLSADDQFRETSWIEFLGRSYMLPGSCVTLAKLSNETVQYFDMYRTSINYPLKIIPISKAAIDEQPKLSLTESRHNFEGATLRSATAILRQEFFKGLEDLDSPEIDTWPKIHYPIILNLAQQLNFKFNITFLDNYGWQRNGTFDGLMGLMQNEEIEFAATGVFMRQDRMLVVDFTIDTFELRPAIIFKQPALSTVSNIFLLPFTRLVWISCGALCLLVIILLVITTAALHYCGTRAYTTTVSIFDLINLVFGFVCQQGTTLMPISLSTRIIIFIFSLCALFFYTSYSANIVALLQSTSPVIKSLSDLTASPLKVKIQEIVYNKVFFKEATDPDVINLYKKKVLPFGEGAYCEPRAGVAMLRSGLVAFSVEVNSGYKIISETFEESEKCGLGEMKLFVLSKLSIPVAKKSGYREIFSRKIIWQRETGIMNRIKKIWLPEKPNCAGTGGGYLRVGLTDFLPALLALAYGFVLSISIFLLEIIFHYRKKRKLRTSKNLEIKAF